MKNKLLFIFFCFLALQLPVRAQITNAEKISEFSILPCGHLLSQAEAVFNLLERSNNSRLFLIYYEGRSYSAVKKGKQQITNPVRGDALNRTKRISLYLTKYRKVPSEKIVLMDGGFRESYWVEVWIVPESANPPQASPTLMANDIKFRKGKPLPVFDCEGSYRNFP